VATAAQGGTVSNLAPHELVPKQRRAAVIDAQSARIEKAALDEA
jgi:hypothetical protein